MNTPLGYELDGAACTFSQFNQIALNPEKSIVVRACAGSGKTWLLTSRIIRLLLDGVAPRHILAITFTKKAAQEMRDRVTSVLIALADGSDDEVKAELMQRGLSSDEADKVMPRARGLFNEILGAGQEIPIYTFHAWFYRLLQAAPMGSPIQRNATLVEDASELKESAWADFYALLNHPDGKKIREHFLWLIREMGDFSVHQIFNNALQNATEIRLFQQHCMAQGQNILAALADDVLTDTGLDIQQGEIAAYTRWSENINQNAQLDTLIQALSCGNASKQARSEAFLQVFNKTDVLAQWQVFVPYLLTDGSRLNANSFKLDKEQKQKMSANITPEQYDEALAAVNQSFTQLQNDLADCRIYQINTHIMPCVEAFLELYQKIKKQSGQLDFSDIEWMCYQMLQNELTAAYVQVQLDARYKHLLFDEFQDTNPLQWHIVYSWLAAYDFDSIRPQVFLVGDVKQSIYRFRKADARVFDEAQHLLVNNYNAHVLRTHATRRNSTAVVDWVNAMFTQEACPLADFSPHHTFNENIGHIGLLGLPEPEKSVDTVEDQVALTRNWMKQPRHIIEASARDDESHLIIDSIQQLVGHYPVKDEHSGLYRPARYSDIMLLVYNRTHLSGYERLLRQAHIPFISSKRGGLLSTLEALDMMALIRWLMDAHDDLSLIHVLRTPIFDITDDDLQFLLRHQTNLSESYWQVLSTANGLPDTLQSAYQLLQKWLELAPFLPPHDMLDKIYAQAEVMKNYARRTPSWLNAQVQANLREFLQLALSVNSGRYPSLWTYLRALQRWRDQEHEGLSEAEPMGMDDAVKILTVHGSKGLEAPIVMLIDMKSKASKNVNLNAWFVDWQPNEIRPNHISWVGKKELTGNWRSTRFAENEERAEREKLNLCYVAMTRARQVLLVSAAQVLQDDTVEASESFSRNHDLYQYLYDAINTLPDESVLPMQPAQWSSAINEWSNYIVATDPIEQPQNALNHNEWSDISLLVTEEKEVTSNQNIQHEAMLLGTAWHGVLEYATGNHGKLLSLSEVVARFGVTFSQADDVCKRAQNILNAPELQQWFDPMQYDEAHNEMTIIGMQGQVRRIDRWVCHGNELTILDYKLDWRDEDLSTYRQQLDEYKQLMQALYQDYRIKGVLLNSDGSTLEL